MCGNSTDGTANMQGQFRGFSTLLSEHSPNQVHIWCYSHLLNLVLADTTGSVVESASLFSLLNDIAVFLRESYKRMQKWEEKSQDKHHRRLCPIGPTRWWAKNQALSKVFGCFGNPQGGLFFWSAYDFRHHCRWQYTKANCEGEGKGIHRRPFEVWDSAHCSTLPSHFWAYIPPFKILTD